MSVLIGNVPADEIRTLRVLVRHDCSRTYAEAANDSWDLDDIGQIWLQRVVLDLVLEGQKAGRKLQRIARRKEDAMEDRIGVVIVWELCNGGESS